MYISTIIGVAVFLLGVVLSQRIVLNANARLEDADKLRIAEVFSKRNFNYTLFIFSVIVIFLLALYLLRQYAMVIGLSYTALLIIYFISKMLLNVRKLKELNAPEHYIRSVIAGFGLFMGGAAAAVAVVIVGLYWAD